MGEKRFSDAYWDTVGCELTRTDTWLRVRRAQGDAEGQWELKLPVEADAKRSGGERTVFTEVEGEASVTAELCRLLPSYLLPLRLGGVADGGSGRAAGAGAGDGKAAASAGAGVGADGGAGADAGAGGGADGGLDSRLRAAGLAPFASFDTVRTRLSLGGVGIDADEASFGHSVVEIEVMCDDKSQVAAAEEDIARVAAAIGARPLSGGTGGKLETYIRRFCPEVLDQLVEAGVLRI